MAPEGYRADGIGFAIDGRSLVRDVSLSFRPGRFYGLIGHNGSGKSTLLKILARQQEATAGSASFEGRPLGQWAGKDFARRVAYLPQSLPAAAGLTVRELAAFGRYPWRGAFARLTPEDHAVVASALARCRLEPFADRLVDTLSGGERQRAWLAMLVAQDSRFVLLDEPVSALDLAQQMDVLGFLHGLARHGGRGVVAVLHDINMAARFCDEILALKGGTLMLAGSPSEIMRAEALEAIYGLPMHVLAHPDGGVPVSVPR